MAHFAKLENGVVTQVIVVDNKDCADASGVEKEYIGAAFCERLFGGTWKQTSYNGNIRKNYAGIGYTFNADIDAFVPPKPFNSWILNEETAQWGAPVAMPDDGQMYTWNEETVFLGCCYSTGVNHVFYRSGNHTYNGACIHW
jgi:hypothetical protein